MPGIFFRYDVFPLRVEVDAVERGTSITRLLIRLSAIIGGAFATGSLLCLLIRAVVAYCLARYQGSSCATPGLSSSAPLIPELDD